MKQAVLFYFLYILFACHNGDICEIFGEKAPEAAGKWVRCKIANIFVGF